MLKVESLSVAAGDFRLRNIDLEVAEGSCHAVLGPSGSGKSILLNALLGILPLQEGRIKLDGSDITHQPIECRGLGYVPQQIGLFPHLTVRNNVTYSARARGLSPSQFKPLMEKLVEATGIGELMDRLPHTLSGGERQRVALVRALTSQPRLVLLDEPFTSLNQSLRRELWWLVRGLQQQQRLTVLLVTHDLTEAYFLADRINVLMDGRIQQSGDKISVYRSPASHDVARFFGVNNLWNGNVTGQKDGFLTIECPSLGFTTCILAGNNPPAAQTCITVGILAEHVVLRDAEHPPKADEHILIGSIRLLDFGPRWLIQFHHATSALVLELYMNRRTAERFGLKDGKTGITVGLPESALFWMPAG
jgi:ABC-type Fe3+/spermidine/putrescine transport system ATPase subunit